MNTDFKKSMVKRRRRSSKRDDKIPYYIVGALVLVLIFFAFPKTGLFTSTESLSIGSMDFDGPSSFTKDQTFVTYLTLEDIEDFNMMQLELNTDPDNDGVDEFELIKAEIESHCITTSPIGLGGSTGQGGTQGGTLGGTPGKTTEQLRDSDDGNSDDENKAGDTTDSTKEANNEQKISAVTGASIHDQSTGTAPQSTSSCLSISYTIPTTQQIQQTNPFMIDGSDTTTDTSSGKQLRWLDNKLIIEPNSATGNQEQYFVKKLVIKITIKPLLDGTFKLELINLKLLNYLGEILNTDSSGTVDSIDAGGAITVDPEDSDGDGVNDNLDNCPDDANTAQTDTDSDGDGDECDDDIDGDTLTNTNEDNGDGMATCSNTADETANCETDPLLKDTDGDGIEDNLDECPRTAPGNIGSVVTLTTASNYGCTNPSALSSVTGASIREITILSNQPLFEGETYNFDLSGTNSECTKTRLSAQASWSPCVYTLYEIEMNLEDLSGNSISNTVDLTQTPYATSNKHDISSTKQGTFKINSGTSAITPGTYKLIITMLDSSSTSASPFNPTVQTVKVVRIGLGDVNDDNVADASDIVALQKHLYGLTNPALVDPKSYNYDINSDNDEDVSDLSLEKSTVGRW